MVAIFTPQPELQKFAFDLSKNQILPVAQFKGATQYEGRVRVRRAANADVSFELLDDTWAGAGIAENDIFVAEGGGIAVQGAWFLRTVIAGEERNVDPVGPSPEILNTFVHAVSSDPISPNFVRGVLDQIVDVRLSEFVALNSNNHRARGTLGNSILNSSDNLRQLTFDGVVSGTWELGDAVTGGTSGAVGTVVGLSPAITQGGAGHWVIVDMGVDYAGAEWTLGEVATSGGAATGTVGASALGARSISPLTKSGSISTFSTWLAVSSSLGQVTHYKLDDPIPVSPGATTDIAFDRTGVLEPFRFSNADGPPTFQHPGPMSGSKSILCERGDGAGNDQLNLNQAPGSQNLLPFIAANVSYSFEVFWKFTKIPTTAQDVAFFAYTTNNGLIRVGWDTSDQKAKFEIQGDTDQVTTLNGVGPVVGPDFGWHHQILVRDAPNDEMRGYLDGVRLTALTYDGTDTQIAGSSEELALGNFDQNDNRRFSGFLSNAVIYTRAITDAQAASLFAASGL